ncbi:MAG: hypothetical protein R3242_02600 [Akkermansiaceae bacterium]|nr:hypothetical protein [Akkermansiaceae bacterium]
MLASCALLRADEGWIEPVLKDVKGMKCPVNVTEGCGGGDCSKQDDSKQG